MPWIPNSQASNSSSSASRAAVTGRTCSHVKPAATRLTTRPERTGLRWRSETSAWRLGSSGVVPSARASTPSGRSCFSASWRTLSALTPRPKCSETTAATCSASRRPSQAAATQCRSGVSLIICPSLRRASSGGSRNPESSYSPSSSTPSASTRTSRVLDGAAGAAGVTVNGAPSALVGVLCELPVEHVGPLGRIGPEHELRVEHVPDTGLLGLDGLMELVDRRVARLERAQVPAHVVQLRAAGTGQADRGVDDAHELAGLGDDLAAGALEVERDGLIDRRGRGRRAGDEHDLEGDGGRLAVGASCRGARLVDLVDHPSALVADVPGEVERAPAVLLDRGLRDVVPMGRLRAAGRQRAGEHREDGRDADACDAGHGATCPWSIVDDWSVVAFATPWSVCTITESWLAVASEIESGDRMFALTPASIGAAMLAFSAIAASIGAARSSARSRSMLTSSSEAGASSRLPAASATGATGSTSSVWLIAESCVDVALASASSICCSADCWSASPWAIASGDSALAVAEASIGTAALAFPATEAATGAARSSAAVRSALRSSSDVSPSAPSRSVAALPTSPTTSPTAGRTWPTESTVSPTTPPTVPSVSLTAGSASPTTPPTVSSVSLTAGRVSPTMPPTVSSVSLTAGRVSSTTPPTVSSVSPTTPPTVSSVSPTTGATPSTVSVTVPSVSPTTGTTPSTVSVTVPSVSPTTGTTPSTVSVTV